jgi:hypothetical protein
MDFLRHFQSLNGKQYKSSKSYMFNKD